MFKRSPSSLLSRPVARVAIIPLTTLVLVTQAMAPTANASERRFTYTYGTDVLAPGQMELEPWTTVRIAREGFYMRMDQRLELELGLTNWLQTAFYLNLTAISKDVPVPGEPTVRETEVEWGGVSSEWKFKLLDPVADPVGIGLYLEGTIAPVEAELEAKFLLDKRLGDVTLAYNLVGEYEAKFDSADETEFEFKVENDLGLAYHFTDQVALGVEVRNVSLFEVGEGFVSSAFFAGPTVSFSQDKWWAALTIMPQIAAIQAEEGAGVRDLAHNEQLLIRLLIGAHL